LCGAAGAKISEEADVAGRGLQLGLKKKSGGLFEGRTEGWKPTGFTFRRWTLSSTGLFPAPEWFQHRSGSSTRMVSAPVPAPVHSFRHWTHSGTELFPAPAVMPNGSAMVSDDWVWEVIRDGSAPRTGKIGE